MAFNIAGRPPEVILRTLTDPNHPAGLLRGLKAYTDPVRVLARYATAAGAYPYTATVRTPIGPRGVLCRSWHDLVTVHEVFARGDYRVHGAPTPRTMIDLGANIGIVALWVLAGRPDAQVHCVEPVPENVAGLRHLLGEFSSRWTLDETAVSTENGETEFGVEPTGRYGGIGVDTGATIRVPTRALGDVLEEQLSSWGEVDLLKVDVEGLETDLLRSLDPSHLRRINSIAMEHAGDLPEGVAPAGFTHTRRLEMHYFLRPGV
jgi:FkbM family methyltransferase